MVGFVFEKDGFEPFAVRSSASGYQMWVGRLLGGQVRIVVLVLALVLVLQSGLGLISGMGMVLRMGFGFRLDDSRVGGQTALLGEDREEHGGVLVPEVGEWVGLRWLGCRRRCRYRDSRGGSVL